MAEISFLECDFENHTHLNTLAELLNAYMTDPMGGVPALNKLQQLRLVDGLANHPAKLILFILCDDEIAGFSTCFVNFSTFNVKSYLNIHDFFVHTKFRGRNLGKQMMQELINISEERKYCKITLEVRQDNGVAQSLYKSMGFDECEPNMLFWTKKIGG